jgi:hypothetical protein
MKIRLYLFNGAYKSIKGGYMKKITIGNKEYEMKSSAYTQFKYRDITGRSLIKDLMSLSKKYEKISNEEEIIEQYEGIDDFINTLLEIAYIMCLEAKSFTGSKDEFLMTIDNYLDNTDWIREVVELALSPLSRTLQTTENKQ